MALVLSAIKLETEIDVMAARGRARQVSRRLGFDDSAQTAICSAIGSMARRSFAAAPGATVEFTVEDAGPPALIVRIEQPGACDPELPAEQLRMDGWEIEAGQGSAVRMWKQLPNGSPLLSGFEQEQPYGVLDEMASLDQELLRATDQLERRQQDLAHVNQELEDTNRGVMALYTELDERTQQLRRTSELKSRFLSNLSHEVRTPVNSILALSGILLNRLDGELSPEQERQVSFIRESAEQLSRLVSNELDMAKVEAGKISLHISDFQIGQVFGALRGMFKPLLQNPAVNLVFEEPESVPALRTDEGKIAQILRNLISNALKFTPAGDIRVSAQFGADSQAVIFTVADSGIGIAPEHQERIFEEFFQVESDATTRNEGAGIGLHLSRQLAELLGGSLSVSSELHSGAVFTAAIPLVCPQARAAASQDGCSILIIDDDRLSRYLLRQNLGDTDCRIVEAGSGAEGLSLARSEKPDLIFLDVIMPDISGFLVLRQLKADSVTRDIPVVIFTSVPPPEAKSDEMACAAAAILYKKDFSRETLREMVRTFNPQNRSIPC
jgi:signal transduction histidine kinase